MPTRSSNERELSSFKTLPAVDDKDWDAASFVDSSVFTSEPGSTIGRVRGCFKVLTLGVAWGVPVGLLVAIVALLAQDHTPDMRKLHVNSIDVQALTAASLRATGLSSLLGLASNDSNASNACNQSLYATMASDAKDDDEDEEDCSSVNASNASETNGSNGSGGNGSSAAGNCTRSNRSALVLAGTRPAPPPADWGNPKAAYEGFVQLNNRSDGFFTAWWNGTRSKLLFEVPSAALGASDFVVSAMASRGDGVSSLLHEPLTGTDFNVFRFDLAPNGRDIDLVVPQLELRLPRNGSIPPAAFRYAAWTGWQRTLPTVKVTEWVLVREENTTAANATANVTNASSSSSSSGAAAIGPSHGNDSLANRSNATDAAPACAHSGPPRMWLAGEAVPTSKPGKVAGGMRGPVASDDDDAVMLAVISRPAVLLSPSSRGASRGSSSGSPPPPPPPRSAPNAPPPCARLHYVRGRVSYLVDVSGWARSGAVLDATDNKLADARLASARAYPSNVLVGVQAHLSPRGDLASDDGDDDAPDERPTPIEVQLSIAQLPPLDGTMVARVADDRIGYWVLHYTEVGSAGGVLSRRTTDRPVRIIHRWHLEPNGTAAADGLVRPARPLRYHVDPSVPERWRGAVKRGIENWNEAFEQAGWRGAVRAVLPTDADWPGDYSAEDVRYPSISWSISMANAFAIGPHTVDPRTGQILDANIVFAHSWVRSWLSEYDVVARRRGAAAAAAAASAGEAASAAAGGGGVAAGRGRLARALRASQLELEAMLDDRGGRVASAGPCGHAGARLRETALLHATLTTLDGEAGGGGGGEGTAEGEEEVPSRYIEEAITEVTMHEVGHTLGLRHNFKASAAYGLEQLADEHFVEEHGLTASVMDYAPPYLPANRSLRHSHVYSHRVGEYDRWAIEYGYTPLRGEVAEVAEVAGQQHAALRRIAARGAANRALRFSTDEDGDDPFANVFDLGDDPLAYYADRMALAQALLAQVANRTVLRDEAWTRQLAAVTSMMRVAVRGGVYAAKYIGGFVFSKAHRGDGGAAEPVVPVAARDQQRALQLLLQVVSQDFWLPAARATRRMPERVGACGGLQEYCLGLSSAQLLEMVRELRKKLLLQLLQPARLQGLEQHEWDAEAALDHALGHGHGGHGHGGGVGEPAELAALAEGPAAAAASAAAAGLWAEPPRPIVAATRAFAAEGPSVGALLRAVDAVLGLPTQPQPPQQPPSPPQSVLEMKMQHEIHRFWVSALAALSHEGVGEEGAVATQLLRDLRARVSRELEAIAAGGPAERGTLPTASAAGMGGGGGDAGSLQRAGAADEAVSPSVERGVRATAAVRQALLAHYGTLEHYLGLWERGLELPGL